jgi:hypothetical protein
MSLARMIYVTAWLAGWAAFFGWLVCEFLVLRGGGGRAWEAVVVASAVGAAIGSGVGGAAGLSEGTTRRAAVRAGYGLLGGFVGGLVGGLAGQLLYAAGLPRVVGWVLMGLGIGATDGLIQHSIRKARNGLIGGAVGGLFGGLLFDPISSALTAGTGMTSRATGFVIMGLSIGALIGVVQVMLRDAWVTVVDGFRTGRQLILTRPVTTLGRSELAHLPFLGTFGKPLEVEHARIERRADARFVLVDNNTADGTMVNREPVTGSVVLNDGDMIRIGANYIRFNEQVRRKEKSESRPTEPRPTAAQGRTGTARPAGHVRNADTQSGPRTGAGTRPDEDDRTGSAPASGRSASREARGPADTCAARGPEAASSGPARAHGGQARDGQTAQPGCVPVLPEHAGPPRPPRRAVLYDPRQDVLTPLNVRCT